MDTEHLQKGFSLMEMIVAVGIFAIVATIAIGALLILTVVEKKVNSNQSNQDNVRFALESIAREIRTGRDYLQNTADCPAPSSCVEFTNINGNQVVYSLDSAGKSINRSENGGTYFRITSTEVQIQSLSFFISDTVSANDFQPRVTIAIKAISPINTADQSVLAVSTAMSQYGLDK